MAKLKIYTFPDLVLAQKAAPVARVDKAMHKITDDMLETMYHAPGIGLAANQVGILQRFLVVDTDYDLEEMPDNSTVLTNKKPQVIFNPEIVYKEGSTAISEGCLSVPDYNAEVKRAEKIKVQYQDIDGLTKTLAAEGLLAIALQHEMDHLDGKLFIDRLSPLKKEMIRKKLKQERVLRDEEERMGVFDPGADPKERKKKGF